MRYLKSLLSTLLWFHLMIAYENLHPLEGGALRLKFRKDRRPGLPIESPLAFYPRMVRESLRKLGGYWSTILQFKAIMKEVRDAPDRASYTDVAITPQETPGVRGTVALSCDDRGRGRARPQAAGRGDPGRKRRHGPAPGRGRLSGLRSGGVRSPPVAHRKGLIGYPIANFGRSRQPGGPAG